MTADEAIHHVDKLNTVHYRQLYSILQRIDYQLIDTQYWDPTGKIDPGVT